MKRFSYLLILAVIALVATISCIKQEDIDNLQSQIDEIKSVQIATIDQQITGINTSLASLQETDKELKGYISTLQNTSTELQRSINSTNDKIDRVEADLKKDLLDTQSNLANDIITAKTELLTSLTALRTDMETQLAVINSNITNLQEKDVALEKKIDDLKTYVDGEIKNTKDWVSATFTTLEQYNALVTEIAGIKANITSINTAISELETRLNGKIASDIATAVSTLEGELQQQATDITQAYIEAIATAKGEIEAAYTNAIAQAIASSESTMQAWVNGRLTGYYTIAETDAKLTTLKQTLETEITGQKAYLEGMISTLETTLTTRIENNSTLISNLQTKVDGLRADLTTLAETVETNAASIAQLQSDLSSAITNITAAYTSAISSAITENNGTINSKIAADIATASAALQQQIDAINTRINNLESRVTTLETNVEDLINRIQGIEVIPSYSDGSVACTMGDNEFYFEVLPSGAASRLATAGKDIFKLKAVYTQTKAAPSFVNLPVSSVRAEGDILVVTASASGLTITAEQSANAILTATSGVSSISTGYFPLYFAASSLVVNATLSASTPFSASFTCNVSKTEGITEYGICYSEGNSLCNNFIKGNNMDVNGTWSVDVTSLTPGTIYYFKSYAILDGVVAQSSVLSLTTSETTDGLVQTLNASSITAFSVFLEAKTTVPYFSGVEYGFCYSKNNTLPTVNDQCKFVTDCAEGAFSSAIYGLSPSTTYNCRAFIRVGSVYVYGESIAFTTLGSDAIVITGDYSIISCTSLKLFGRLTIDDNSFSSISFGFEIDDDICSSSSYDTEGQFSAVRYKLHPGTKYSYRAFARIDEAVYYGDYVEVTMDQLSQSADGVDLGFGKIWSTANLGANSPTDKGNYYKWGEIQPSTLRLGSTPWNEYKWSDKNSEDIKLLKYCSVAENGYYGYTDNKTTLDSEDDAAVVGLGNGWHTPSSSEWNQLLSRCRWDAMTINGVSGYMVTSKVVGYESKCIFIPANYDLYDRYGFYWASSLVSDRNGSNLWFEPSSNWQGPRMNYYYGGTTGTIRTSTLSIRPVRDK